MGADIAFDFLVGIALHYIGHVPVTGIEDEVKVRVAVIHSLRKIGHRYYAAPYSACTALHLLPGTEN